MNDYYLELIRQKPINYNGLLFYPIQFSYICDNIGLKNFDDMLVPFLITKDCLDIEEELLPHFNLFIDVILKVDDILHDTMSILQLFCKCKDVVADEKRMVLLFDDNRNFIIDSNNFEDICQIIMKINGKQKLKVEKPPKNMSDRQRDIWEKLQAGRKRESQKNTVHIYDILNVCEFGGNYHIPIEEIESWTIWKIINCYKARVDMKTYDDSLKICLVSGEGKNISGDNYWHHKLLVRE